MPAVEAAPEAALIDEVADWLMKRALLESSLTEIAEGCFLRLHAAGIPLFRAHIAFRTLHPLYGAVGVIWTPSSGMVTEHYADPDETNEAWRQSPGYHLIRTRLPLLRRRLTGPEAQLDFPILEEFREQGASDYLAYLFIFDEAQETGLWGSWLCDRPSGFSEAELRALQRIQRRLAVALKVTIKEQIARNVVATYLGPDAGERVLRGQIRRGDGKRLHAAIWMSDLRDSTALAAALPPEDFLALLNGYFECTAGAVLARGGEVLLLVGDAVLAIFPLPEVGGAAEACQAAFEATRDAEARLSDLNKLRGESGGAAIAFGIGLHLGELMFGNIGVPERLQFTVVGPAANEVARIEALTKTLGQPILASAAFAKHVALEWESLGRHELRGVSGPREVFAPPR